MCSDISEQFHISCFLVNNYSNEKTIKRIGTSKMPLRLFEKNSSISRTNIKPSGLLYLSSEIGKILSRYINYYQNVENYVNGKNTFVRMVEYLRMDISDSEDEIDGKVRDKYLSLGSMFGLVSFQKRGEAVYPGSFYGSNATEIWIGNDEYFDKSPKGDLDILDTLEPVKVIRHDHDVLTFPYLNGQYVGPANEMVVLSMNIPMLTYMLYIWDKRCVRKEGGILPAEVFVTNVIMPKLITSHVEVTILNQIFNEVRGIPNTSGEWYRNPFYIQDLSLRVRSIVREISDRLKSQPLTYDEILDIVPGILLENKMFDIIRLPNTFITHNNRWAYLVAYLPVLNNFVILDGMLGNNRNLGYRGRLWQYIRFIRNDSTIKGAFSKANPVMARFINAELEELKLNIEDTTTM